MNLIIGREKGKTGKTPMTGRFQILANFSGEDTPMQQDSIGGSPPPFVAKNEALL
jgi:hypothetical protein